MVGPASHPEGRSAGAGRQHLLGITLIGTGVLGLVFSLIGLIVVAVVGTAIETMVLRELGTLDRTLAISSDGLVVTEEALGNAQTLIAGISSTVSQTTDAITTTLPTLNAVEQLTGVTLPATINSTRQALDSAKETARVADGVLGTLAIFGVNYNPEVPLNVAIGGVSESLADLPADLEQVATGIGEANEQVGAVAEDLGNVATNLDALGVQIGEAALVIQEYQTLVGDLRTELAAIKEAAPGWILGVRIGLTLFLIWMGLAQLGLITQGMERLGRGRASEE